MDLTMINWTLVTAVAFTGVGYWLRGQNLTTLQADVVSIKNEIEKLKALFTPAPSVSTAANSATPAAVTPVATVAN